MFDLGGGELLVIGIVALVVIGPKELPGLLRTIGQAVGKMRRMAGDFQGQFNEAMKEADLSDTQKILTDLHSTVRSKIDIRGITDMAEAASTSKLVDNTNPAVSADSDPPAPEPSLMSDSITEVASAMPLILSDEVALEGPGKKKSSRKKRVAPIPSEEIDPSVEEQKS